MGKFFATMHRQSAQVCQLFAGSFFATALYISARAAREQINFAHRLLAVQLEQHQLVPAAAAAAGDKETGVNGCGARCVDLG